MPSRGHGKPRRGIGVSSRWGWGPSAIEKMSGQVLKPLTVCIAASLTLAAMSAAPADMRSTIAARVTKLTRNSAWKPVASVRIKFPAHHPQGLVKIGERLREIELDAFSAAAPMTYLHGGKQYIVVATGSGPTSELVALGLP